MVHKVLEILMEGAGDGGLEEGALEEVAVRFEQLLENPLDINRAGREELEELHVLSDFQIESILEYRRVSGNIMSAA